jgi:hypothetical protein
VSGRQQTRLKGFPSVLQRSLEIETPEHSILTRAQRQIHKRHRGGLHGRRSAVANLATRRRLTWSAVVGAPNDALDRGHHTSKPTSRGALRAPLIASDQHAADTGIDRAKQEGALQLLLTDKSR